MTLGVEFYTLRELTQTTEGISECLKKIADIGYQSVELAGQCAFDPVWMKDTLKSAGLSCPTVHADPAFIAANPAEAAAFYKIFGCEIVGVGGVPESGNLHESFDSFVQKYAPISSALKAAGAEFQYHNHHQEFARRNGKTFLSLMKDAIPDMLFEIDVYWAAYAGCDPTRVLKEFTGRQKVVHLKDMAVINNGQRMCPVGEGNIDFESIISLAPSVGIEHLIVEQDDLYGDAPFDCLKRSYKYVKSIL
jgi:Sugar phosphate isomerases/epimerases